MNLRSPGCTWVPASRNERGGTVTRVLGLLATTASDWPSTTRFFLVCVCASTDRLASRSAALTEATKPVVPSFQHMIAPIAPDCADVSDSTEYHLQHDLTASLAGVGNCFKQFAH